MSSGSLNASCAALWCILHLLHSPRSSSCHNQTCAGQILSSFLGFSISSEQLQVQAASGLDTMQQQPQLQNIPHPAFTCNLHACSEPGTSTSCQPRPIMELDPSETGMVLVELASILHPAHLLQQQQQQSNNSSLPKTTAAPGVTRAAVPIAAAEAAASANSITVKLAALCRARTHSSRDGQVNSTAADTMQQYDNSTANQTYSTVSHQQAGKDAEGVWTEIVQVILLQPQQPGASPSLQDCPAGAAAATVWLLPDILADYKPTVHNSPANSSRITATGKQQKQMQQAESARWDGLYEDVYDDDLLANNDTDHDLADMTSRALVLVDLLLPNIDIWSQHSTKQSSDSSSEQMPGSMLAQQDGSASVGSLELADSAGRLADADTSAWLWVGRLLMLCAVVGIQLVWQLHSK